MRLMIIDHDNNEFQLLKGQDYIRGRDSIEEFLKNLISDSFYRVMNSYNDSMNNYNDNVNVVYRR